MRHISLIGIVLMLVLPAHMLSAGELLPPAAVIKMLSNRAKEGRSIIGHWSINFNKIGLDDDELRSVLASLDGRTIQWTRTSYKRVVGRTVDGVTVTFSFENYFHKRAVNTTEPMYRVCGIIIDGA